MSSKINSIHQLFLDAIAKGVALQTSEVLALRAQSKKAVTIFRSIFWIGIIIFNVTLWVPLPLDINKGILYVISFIALLVALIVPILGLKKHQLNLELLKVSKEIPKKKSASEAGRVYIEQVKKQERSFVNAEFELLEGGKWASRAASSDC